MQERFTRILLSSILVLSCTVNCYAVITESTVDEVSLSASKDEQIIHLNDELRKLGRRINGITIPSEIVSGMIVMWGGYISDIPDGWQLCDGSNGTVDLRNRFIICADADSGGTTDTGSYGDATATTDDHTLTTAEMPSHNHNIKYYSGSGSIYPSTQGAISKLGVSNFDTVSETSWSTSVYSMDTTGSGDGHAHDITDLTPKYFALAFIQKL